MQTKNAIRTRRLFHLLILFSISTVATDLSLGQEQSKFQISPARRNLGNQDNAESTPLNLANLQDNISDLGNNDLRNPAIATQPQPAFEPIPNSTQDSTSRNANSILKSSPEFPAMPPINANGTQRPKFNPADFDLPPITQNNRDNNAQPARDISTMSPESFRDPNFNQGNIRTVSANLQEDGRNTARGTQPIGDSTQTRQQDSFTPPQQNLSQNFGGQSSGNFQAGSGGIKQSPNAFSPQPDSSRSTMLPTSPSNGMNLNSNNVNSLQPASPRVGNNRSIGNAPIVGNNDPQRVFPQTPPASPQPNSATIKTLMSQYSPDRALQPLPGEPVAMQQMLEMTPPQNRPAMVNQYWATYQAWCEFVCSKEYSDALGQITPPNNPAEKHLLTTARAMADNELLAAEIQLTKAQSRLQKFMPHSQHDLVLPLPSDHPVVTSYNTHIDYYASRSSLPNNVMNIAQSLPKMLQLISQQAQTAQASQNSMEQIRQFTQGGRAPISEALYAVRMWSDANKQVVHSVVDYNRSIAVYSMSVMGAGKSVDQLASALVSKPYQSNSVLNPDVRQATLPPEFQQGRQSTTIPPTNFNSQPSRQLTPNNSGNFNSGNPTFNGGRITPPANNNQFNGGSTFPSTPGNFRGG